MNTPAVVQNRPAETAQAGASGAVGAIIIILHWAGIDVPPEVVGAAMILLGFVAAWVTKMRSKRPN
jgi:hypothetical protein